MAAVGRGTDLDYLESLGIRGRWMGERQRVVFRMGFKFKHSSS